MKPYPKYKREQKTNAKLTEKQVSDIVARNQTGETKTDLAKEFGVTVPTIFWICLPKEERERRVRIYNQRKKHASYNSKERRAEKAIIVREKKLLFFKNFRDYERGLSYSMRHHGEERPAKYDTMTVSEKATLAGIKGGAATKKKGRKYYQSIVNKRWGKV